MAFFVKRFATGVCYWPTSAVYRRTAWHAFTHRPNSDLPSPPHFCRQSGIEACDAQRQKCEGEDFGGLVKKHTDDSYPGIYGMSNIGVQKAKGEYERNRMVPAFGDTGFPLKVGGIGISDFDPKKSPYGWHIVKRTK